MCHSTRARDGCRSLEVEAMVSEFASWMSLAQKTHAIVDTGSASVAAVWEDQDIRGSEKQDGTA